MTGAWWVVYLLGSAVQVAVHAHRLRRLSAGGRARFTWRSVPDRLEAVSFVGFLVVLVASGQLSDGTLAFGAFLFGSVAAVASAQVVLVGWRNRQLARASG